MSATPSENAASKMPASVEGEASPLVEPAAPAFPPYPPYKTEPAPPSVANTIIAGRDIRIQHKSIPKQPVRPAPKPAKPRSPKATDVKLSRRATRAHARCLRRHGAVLTDRLEMIAKPTRRNVINLWRDHAHDLAPETIYRLRSMLDADEPFKPDQAYEYFVNLRKTKKKNAAKIGVNQIKKDLLTICSDKKFIWARNATVAFARGIQMRLTRPGHYVLADEMLRLSNIVLDDMCKYIHIKTPSRRCRHPKAKFMMEMADKITVWIDDVLTESEDRMLMMDFDEDDEVLQAGQGGFTDNFLDMMGDGAGGAGGGGGPGSKGLLEPRPAYMKFKGPMLEAFLILTDSMTQKGDEQLLSHGKFQQTYREGATELKETTDFDATDYDCTLAARLNKDLAATAQPNTPPHLAPSMKEIVGICSNYLAQNAEFNKDKGPAFKLLVKMMKTKPKEQLYKKEKASRTYGSAANELEKAKGLESDHDDPNLSQEIHSLLSILVAPVTPEELKSDMKETLDVSSKYLSQSAVDEIERGPAFDILIKELEKDGSAPFTPQFDPVSTKHAAAYTLKSAPGMSGVTPDPKTVPIFKQTLQHIGSLVAPPHLKADMEGVVDRCSNYLSAFVRDRGRAMELLMKTMKGKGKQELTKRNNYKMDYTTGAQETENAPTIVPFLPVKDVANEIKEKLATDVEKSTPMNLKTAMKTLVQDVGRHLSQAVALKSGIAGERYALNFLTAIKQSLGIRPLYKTKTFGQTYGDAAEELKYAGVLESDHGNEELHQQIKTEMKQGVPTKLTTSVTQTIDPIMNDASKHLAKVGSEKGKAMDYVVKLMKEEGDAPLEKLQGYMQTYNDGARRIENATSLANDKVEKAGYESVKTKLTAITDKKPDPTHDKHLPGKVLDADGDIRFRSNRRSFGALPGRRRPGSAPAESRQFDFFTGLIDDSAKFLAAPFPENDADKRRVLADLMGRKGDEVLGQDGPYKMTYKEGGAEIMNAPVGVTTASDEKKKADVLGKINEVIPDEQLKQTLKDPAHEGAAYLSDVIKDKGEAMRDGGSSGRKSHAGQLSADEEARRRAEEEERRRAAQDQDKDSSGRKSHAGQLSADEEARRRAEEEERRRAAQDQDKDSSGRKSHAGQLSADDEARRRDEEARRRAEEEERRRAEEEERRRAEEEERRRAKEEERRRKTGEGGGGRLGMHEEDGVGGGAKAGKRAGAGAGAGAETDPEREAALGILHSELKSRGGENFYKQPSTQISHSQASDWLKKPPMKVDKSIKECADTDRLHKKFERKLSGVVAKKTPSHMVDVMQDVVIESSRMLSEYFVASNYKALARVGLISEMQKRGNEILVETNGAAETFFFAAQRLKKATTTEAKEPRASVAYYITKKLDDMIRCRSMARKLTSTMKDHIKGTADYLSELATTPDEEIAAYVALLGEMEANGDALLIEGDIPKSFKDAAAYLRQLTTSKDEINMSNSSLQSNTESKLKRIMANVPPAGYTSSVLNGVISKNAKLLVSYIMLQGEKTKVLKVLVEKMNAVGDNVLLRHGTLRKTFIDGADLLRDKNNDQLRVPNGDPVVARKIQIKLNTLMAGQTPEKFAALMDDVIEDATNYLAVHLLQPQFIQVCKCMKNVFVQCELWCDEILRRVTRPCCSCTHNVLPQTLLDLAPGEQIRISPSCSRAFAPGTEISLKTCPSKIPRTCIRRGENPPECPAMRRTDGCKNEPTASYLLYNTMYDQQPSYSRNPSTYSTAYSSLCAQRCTESKNLTSFQSLLLDIYKSSEHSPTKDESEPEHESQETSDESAEMYFTAPSTSSKASSKPASPFSWSPRTKYSEVVSRKKGPCFVSVLETTIPSFSSRTPIVTTDQMGDWHAMMVSLVWNVQAWRDWIQDCVDRALSYKYDPNILPMESEEKWAKLRTRITNEALQWRQYNSFSRQLTLRLASRYENKQIVSPTRSTVKTDLYIDCQSEMIDIIEMFYRWTRWLIAVVTETDMLKQVTGSDVPLHITRWNYFKRQVEKYAEDWKKYKTHLSVCWEHKYRSVISEWLPSWNQPGPVWVVSACGAVPSGAAAAGLCDGEVIWVARTTHKKQVMPAALYPSKHCCLVYADGSIYHYTKYQVMCNAEVKWKPWKAGKVASEAVKVARDVYVGRVHYRDTHLLGAVRPPFYRCHVVIFNRPFAFKCYDLLVLENGNR